MKLVALPLVAVACAAALLSTPAAARDTKYMLPFADVLNMPEAQEKLDGSVKFYLSGPRPRRCWRRRTATSPTRRPTA
ncbi:hypothetical protein [Cupriavidus sp. EM10]